LEEVDGWGGAGSWGGANSYAQATAWASTVQVQDVFREHHRHDLHQVLAYSSMYDTPRVTAALVYPTTFDTGQRLAEGGRDVSMGVLDGPGRQIRLALVAVPIGGPVQTASAAAVAPAAALSQSWGRLRGEY
jgi:hypothetical protein